MSTVDLYADCRRTCGSPAGCFPEQCRIDQGVTASVPAADATRQQLGQATLHAMLTSRHQPNSGGLALDVADALLPTVHGLIADELEAVRDRLTVRHPQEVIHYCNDRAAALRAATTEGGREA